MTILKTSAPPIVTPPEQARRPTSSRQRGGSVARYAILTIFAIGFLAPIYVMVAASLKPSAAAGIEGMWQLPFPLDFSGLATAWNKLSPNMMNSVILVIPATVISSLIGSLNGFLLAKIRFKYSNIAFIVILVGMYIPYQAILVPLVQFLQSVNLYGTLAGLILTSVIYGLPITTLIFRNYYTGIPSELVEAAQVDGAGLWRTYLSVFLPLSAPGFVVCAIFQFTNIWNDFLFALVVIPSNKLQPITVALNNLSGTTSVDWNVVMAGALIAAVPTIIAYIFFGRFFVKGLMAGSYR
jgi:glucose/mannose transport system permease protein